MPNGRHSDASVPLRYSAGKLGQLPAELLIQILQQIDIPSLTRFRRVNRRAMELVNSLPYYNVLVKHCPHIARAILSVQAETPLTAAHYIGPLVQSNVQHASVLAIIFYLADCRRVCYFCYTRQPEFFPTHN